MNQKFFAKDAPNWLWRNRAFRVRSDSAKYFNAHGKKRDENRRAFDRIKVL
jgi:hypothetical protein